MRWAGVQPVTRLCHAQNCTVRGAGSLCKPGTLTVPAAQNTAGQHVQHVHKVRRGEVGKCSTRNWYTIRCTQQTAVDLHSSAHVGSQQILEPDDTLAHAICNSATIEQSGPPGCAICHRSCTKHHGQAAAQLRGCCMHAAARAYRPDIVPSAHLLLHSLRRAEALQQLLHSARKVNVRGDKHRHGRREEGAGPPL
jgi:hypothetical protein